MQFQALQDLQTGIGFTTVLEFGPEDPDPASNADGCLYAVHGSEGEVHRICFDATKTVTSDTVVIDLNGGSGTNNTLGITIDPASDPSSEIHLYLAFAYSNAAPNNGRIARAVSSDGGVSYTVDESFITGLGRSSFNHQSNGLDFGPDGCLYLAQGNQSNAGYDIDFAETRLSSAVLRACFKDGSGGVDPAFDGNCGDGNTQQACDVEVYASGLRNPYDILWHSNGSLYNSDNDANPGFRDNCGSEANNFGCACQAPVVNPSGDEINLIEQGKYYGSPNPYRAFPSSLQCQGGSDGGDSCTTDTDCGGGGTCENLSSLCSDGVCGDVSQCFYFGEGEDPQAGEDPSGIYRAPIAQGGSLLDGLTEYRSRFDSRFPGSFCSDWNGDLLVTGGPGTVRRFELSSDGQSATDQGTAGLGGASGLDVVVGPDGTLYTADLNAGKVTYLLPVTQADPQLADFFLFCDVSLESGSWDAPSTPASLPIGRSDLAAGWLDISGDDYVFVLGQQGSNEVLRYNVAADSWARSSDPGTQGAPPNPPFPLTGPPTSNHKGAVRIGSLIYLIGGLNPFDHDTWGYDGINDPAGNHFSHIGCNGTTQNCSGGDHIGSVTDNGLNVGASAVAVLDGQIYSAGGLCNTSGAGSSNCTCNGVVGGTTGNCSGNVGSGQNTDRAFRYVPATDDWFEIASMPVGLDHSAGAEFDGRFYVFGGRQCGANTACEGRTEVQIYDPASDSWSFGSPMLEGCSGMGSAIVMNQRIYVIGGEGAPCTGTSVQEYDPFADSWRFVTDLPTVHHGIWPVRIGDPTDGDPDRVFVAGGAPSSTLHHVLGFTCEECGAGTAASSGGGPVCGNGILEGAEICDDGASNGTMTCGCAIDCTYPVGGTACDDGSMCSVADQCDGVGACLAGTPLVCDDGQFCNGLETCDPGTGCQAGTPVNPDDGAVCTDDSCDEVGDVVVNTPNDANCANGDFCDGDETCDAVLDCQAGTPVDPDDGVVCTDDSCDEVGDVVVNTPNDANCANGDFCDGSETCDVTLGCQAGTPPPIDDGVACTDDSCDEAGDVIVNTANAANCEDANPCTADSCDAILGCMNDPIPDCTATPVPTGWAPSWLLLALVLVAAAWRTLSRPGGAPASHG